MPLHTSCTRRHFLTPRILKTGTHYREALDESKRLARAKPARGTAAADRLELINRLLRDYEYMRLEKTCADPVAAIRLRMEQRGLQQKDLAAALGGKNRVSEVLAGKRALTVAMIRALCGLLDIPAALLIRPAAPRRKVQPARPARSGPVNPA